MANSDSEHAPKRRRTGNPNTKMRNDFSKTLERFHASHLHPFVQTDLEVRSAVEHIYDIIQNLLPNASHELAEAFGTFKSNFDAARTKYDRQKDYELLYWYLIELADELCPTHGICDVVKTFISHDSRYRALIAKVRSNKTASQRRRRREAILHSFIERHGGLQPGYHEQLKVYCYDVITGKRLNPADMSIMDIDDPLPTPPPDTNSTPLPATADHDVPPPAASNPFPPGFVTTAQIKAENFKILSRGTVYGFARAPNNQYQMVFAAQFSSLDDMNAIEKQAIDAFVQYIPFAAQHAHEVTINKAQNVEDVRYGRLWSTGWRVARSAHELFGEYVPQSAADRKDPSGYIRTNLGHHVISMAWRTLQERLSPRAVKLTCDTLKAAAVPLFGYHDTDITTHGPALGSNMAIGSHDQDGRCFANGVHIDRDIDSLTRFYGKVFTFGLWFHTGKDGKILDGTRIKDSIPDGYFVLPGYRVAIDLGAATVTTAMWRGGMDVHVTSTAQAKTRDVIRWGMSIQTSKKMPERYLSGSGAIKTFWDHLYGYFTAMTGGSDDD
ncbi:unnamed protein product [Rhizoctonia solani]|uniref:Tet-like 2OG-Fe(II) oxygenase domain-containing protein n=1 Tax=Rhizoctonia solani TaxID=456999 RepID=A0A8H3AQK1_9AGAM|nr:unnamed protein product [Rhizoctonia solani]